MDSSQKPPAYSEVQVDPIPTTVWVQANQPAPHSVSGQTGDPGAAYPATAGIVPISEETEPPAVHDGWVGKSFTDRNIRHAFIKKVYLILMAQLIVTVSVICLFIFCKPLKKWVQDNGWFYWTSFGVFVVTYIVLICCAKVRRKFPANFICLAIFTLALTFVAATISSYYDTNIVLITMGITAGVCLAISIFAIQTKIDFTLCGGLLFALCIILLFSGIICLVFWQTRYYHYMSCLYGALAAVVFSLLLIFDTQRVVGGENRQFPLSPEEYIAGALELYLDIVYLFIILLSCCSGSN